MKLKTIILTLVCSASLLAMETEEENTSISQHNLDVTCLDLSHDESLTDISFIRHFPNLVELNLEDDCYLGNNYKPICKILSLTRLNLSGVAITKLKPLKKLTNLTYLNLHENNTLKKIAPICSLKNLHTLDISLCFRIIDLECIGQITSLVNLNMSHAISIEDNVHPRLNFISALINLENLDVSCNFNLLSISPIELLPKLRRIKADMCSNVQDLNLLKKSQTLTDLIVDGGKYRQVSNFPRRISITYV